MDISTIIAIAIIILPWILLLVSMLRRKKLNKHLSEAKKINEKYTPIIDIEEHCRQLSEEAKKYTAAQQADADGIVEKAKGDAKVIVLDANNIKSEALKTLNHSKGQSATIKREAQTEASNVISLAQVQATEITLDARTKLSESKDKSEAIKTEARTEAAKVLSFAEEQAKKIAGDAYEAKEKADTYEKAIRAMRNTINGYKDDYIIPNHSVLDDLAEEFSHKEAGEELKVTRKRIREMIKEGHAGECDYAETNRRTYAIHFAIDAFNGKVASALSKVKHDNYGKIKQEIIDAYALVNHNGTPFKNARITQEFLDARMTELKWAVATFELRNIEKQEQAAIKAQIREEERAIREMEKAQKEAEKEERLLQKALTEARKELAHASDEQKAKYEAQLTELEAKLHEAEEKGQRAMSMAQQTRRGHVYVISNVGSFGEQVFKIGMTRRLEPLDRVKELGDASVPFSFDVHAMIYSEDAPTLEKALHKKFNLQTVNKINPRKEFFRTSIAEIKQAVEQTDSDKVHWTLKSEAVEYRESLAIEKELQGEAVNEAV